MSSPCTTSVAAKSRDDAFHAEILIDYLWTLYELGRPRDVVALEHSAAAVVARAGSPSQRRGGMLMVLASANFENGHTDLAVELDKRAVELFAADPDTAPDTLASSLGNLGIMYARLGRMGPAIEYLERSLAVDMDNFGDQHPETAYSLHNLGQAHIDHGNPDRGAELLSQSLAIREKRLGSDHSLTLTTVSAPAMADRDRGRLDSAAKLFQRALNGQIAAVGENHSRVHLVRIEFARAYLETKRYDDALAIAQQSIDAMTERDELPLHRAEALFVQGQALLGKGA